MENKKEEFVGILQENKIKMTVKQEGQKTQQYVCAIIAALGAFVIGTVLAWTSPCDKFLKDPNATTPIPQITLDQSNWIAAWTPIGAITGALPAGAVADMFGRRRALMIFTVPWIVSWIGITFAPSIIVLYVSRFISGVILGLFSAVIPTYITEIAEVSIRGTLGTLFQVFLTLGILFVYAIGSFDSYFIVSIACTAATVVFQIGLFFIPESPLYLAKKNRKSEAERSLRRLRGSHYDVNSELNELRKNIENSTSEGSNFTSLMTKGNIKALFITLGLMAFQQLSGINGVIFFADSIFTGAGAENPAMCTIIVGIVQTIATVVSSVLVDRAGRRILLFVSSLGMAICLAVFGYYFRMKEAGEDVKQISWLPLLCMVVFIAVFSLGMGPLPWMMMGEIQSPELKPFGSGAAVGLNLICVALVTFFFQPLTILIGSGMTFWIFTIVCVLSCIFILIIVPETKGKSIQEIQDELNGSRKKKGIGAA